jgi:uncharacterized protein YkwD
MQVNSERTSRSAAGREVRLPVTRAALFAGGVAVLCGAVAGCSGQTIEVAGPVELGMATPSTPPAPAAQALTTPGADAATTTPDAVALAPARTRLTPSSRTAPTVSAKASATHRTPTAKNRSMALTPAGRSAAASRSAAAQASSAAARSGSAHRPVQTTAPRTPSASPTAVPGTGPALLFGAPTEGVAEAEVVRLVNVARQSAGCAPVTVNGTLVQLARAHSQDMAGPAGFRHNASDGLTPFQRMNAAGYDYSVAAENIAAGQPNAGAVMAAWLASPGHRANIVDCRLTQIGVGVVNRPGSQYVVYWTQEFGTPM